MKTTTTPNPDNNCHHSIAINYQELALLLLDARNDFEYLALQLEIGSGSEFLTESITRYRHKARQAEDFCKQIVALIALEDGAS